jgi:hypothetical protein
VLGNHAFASSTSLKTANLPSATSIGEGAFFGCISLTSVHIPSAVGLGDDAFSYCGQLTSVYLPFAEDIGAAAFFGCGSLTTIDFGSSPKSSIPTISSSSFSHVPTTCRFIIPIGMYDEWIAADKWKDLYAAGYKFEGYASTEQVKRLPTHETVTNVARAVSNSFWDEKNEVLWRLEFRDGEPMFVPVTNENVKATGGVL